MFAHGYLRKPHAVRVRPPPSMNAWFGSQYTWSIGTVQWP